MGMIGMTGGFTHAVSEGSVSSQQPLDQAFAYQKIQDAVKGHFVDGYTPLDPVQDLRGGKRFRSIADGTQNRFATGRRIKASLLEQDFVIALFTHKKIITQMQPSCKR
jgi:hypothetical protein